MALSNLLTFFVGGGGRVVIFFICWVLRVSSGTSRQSQDSSDKCLKSDYFDNVKACKSLPFMGCVWRGPNGLTLFYTITALCLLVWIAYETFWAKSCHRNLMLDLGLPCSNKEKNKTKQTQKLLLMVNYTSGFVPINAKPYWMVQDVFYDSIGYCDNTLAAIL